MPSPQGKEIRNIWKDIIYATYYNIISDSSNSGGDNMYTLMKPVNSGNMGAVSTLIYYLSEIL